MGWVLCYIERGEGRRETGDGRRKTEDGRQETGDAPCSSRDTRSKKAIYPWSVISPRPHQYVGTGPRA